MVSAAVVLAGEAAFRVSVSGEPRGPLCGMGICFECRVTIDGRAHQRACQILCRPGMHVWTDARKDS
jgi:sarcosine oxidase subunit alpha